MQGITHDSEDEGLATFLKSHNVASMSLFFNNWKPFESESDLIKDANEDMVPRHSGVESDLIENSSEEETK